MLRKTDLRHGDVRFSPQEGDEWPKLLAGTTAIKGIDRVKLLIAAYNSGIGKQQKMGQGCSHKRLQFVCTRVPRRKKPESPEEMCAYSHNALRQKLKGQSIEALRKEGIYTIAWPPEEDKYVNVDDIWLVARPVPHSCQGPAPTVKGRRKTAFPASVLASTMQASPALGDALINAQGFNTVLTSELTKMGVTSTPLPDMEVPTNTANKARRDLLKKIHRGKQKQGRCPSELSLLQLYFDGVLKSDPEAHAEIFYESSKSTGEERIYAYSFLFPSVFQKLLSICINDALHTPVIDLNFFDHHGSEDSVGAYVLTVQLPNRDTIECAMLNTMQPFSRQHAQAFLANCLKKVPSLSSETIGWLTDSRFAFLFDKSENRLVKGQHKSCVASIYDELMQAPGVTNRDGLILLKECKCFLSSTADARARHYSSAARKFLENVDHCHTTKTRISHEMVCFRGRISTIGRETNTRRPRNAGVVTTYASWFATNLDRLYNGKNTMVQLSDTQYVPIMMSDPQLIEEQNNNTIDCSHCKEISANEVSIGEINGPEYKVTKLNETNRNVYMYNCECKFPHFMGFPCKHILYACERMKWKQQAHPRHTVGLHRRVVDPVMAHWNSLGSAQTSYSGEHVLRKTSHQKHSEDVPPPPPSETSKKIQYMNTDTSAMHELAGMAEIVAAAAAATPAPVPSTDKHPANSAPSAKKRPATENPGGMATRRSKR
eukprot:m.30665 g.30665  ORF g.30665 m.30665 type:complete len:715 (+) comp8225_c0_seq2:92-2236(+)